MKSVAIIPIKAESQRVSRKNFRLINGIPLYEHFLNKMDSCNFDNVYVDTDSDEIRRFLENTRFHYIQRLPELATSQANGNHLLNYHAEIIEADYYFQLFITSPLMKVKTINDCIEILLTKQFDSVLTAKSLYTWFWFENKAVNYDPKILPRSQDAKPVIMETTGLYGITRQALLENKARIGESPYFYEVTDEEALDLDNEFDFRFLEFYVQKHLSGSDGK